MWTVDRIKEELPDVCMLVNKQVVTARVLGRKLPFARVYLPCGQVYEFGWQTICNALNTGLTLTI
jgi:hypothetical protein